MIPSLHIMQWVGPYCIIIICWYIIITPGSIVTHYYYFQFPELAYVPSFGGELLES